MLVLPQMVKVRWHSSNKKFYVNKKYVFTKIGDEFEVYVLDLMEGSSILVEVKCNNCSKPIDRKYNEIVKNQRKGFYEDYCLMCNSRRMAFDYNYVRDYFRQNGCLLLSTEYKNVDDILDYICVCEKPSKISFDSFKRGARCKSCGIKKMAETQSIPIDKVRKIFEDGGCELISSIYKNALQKLDFICECGENGNIDLQHFQRGQRCGRCNELSHGESKISKFLKENNIAFDPQYTFKNFKIMKSHRFDFAIFDNDGLFCLVEYDGIQHYEPVKFFGGEKKFEIQKNRDSIKNTYCIENNIPLIRIPYWEFDNIEKILSDKLCELNKNKPISRETVNVSSF